MKIITKVTVIINTSVISISLFTGYDLFFQKKVAKYLQKKSEADYKTASLF